MILIVIGIPAFNEERNIATIVAKLIKKGYTVVVCNDGSTDLTGEIAEKMGAIILNHPKNLGYGAGIRSLFLKAKELKCDVLVTFDADGQHRVEDIPSLIKPILNNEADIIIGSRFLNKDNDSMPSYRKTGIKTITKLANLSFKNKITDSQSGLRAYNNKSFNEILPSDYGMGVSTEILIKASKKNLRVIEVPIKINYDGETSTHHPVSHGAAVLMSTMKFVSIEHPLKFYGIPGIIFLVIGLFFIVWTIQAFTETRQVITNITLIGIGSTILGVMLLLTSILLYSLINVVRERHK